MKRREWLVQDIGSGGEVLRDARVSDAGLEIGRTAQSMGCPDDLQMSAQHARLFVRDGKVFVEDLDSATGVWLRVRADKGWGLKEDDQIWLGAQILLIRRREDAWELRHHGPDGRLREKHRVPEQGFFLGRTSDLVLDREDSRLSRRHAQIVREGEGLRLYDRGAHNGTYIKLAEPLPLQHGDEFRLATHRFRVEAIPEAAEPEMEPSVAVGAQTEHRKPSLAARLKKLGRRPEVAEASELLEAPRGSEVPEAPEVIEETAPVENRVEELEPEVEAGAEFADEATVMVFPEEEVTQEGSVPEAAEEPTVVTLAAEAELGETLPPSTRIADLKKESAAIFEIVLEREGEEAPLTIAATAGQTLLEAVKAAGLERGEPVDWECGDGGCGVCVVGLIGGGAGLEPPDPSGEEMKTIQITEQVAPDPAQYRLACLARVRGNIRLRRL